MRKLTLSQQYLFSKYGVKLNSDFVTFVFFICLVGAEATVKLQTPELVEIHQTRDPPNIRHKQRQKLKMPDSDKQSLGYETMTTVSDLDSEVSFSVYSSVLHKNIE